MDHRDYMDDRTYRMMEQTRQQMISGMVPDINLIQPTIDVDKMLGTTRAFDQLQEQLNSQSASVIQTAIQGDRHRQSSLSEQIAAAGANALDGHFGRGLGAIGQTQAFLALTYTPPTISEWLYGSKGFRSVFDTIGPSVSQMAAGLGDMEAWKDLGTPDYGVYEKWRQANVGALANIDGVFGSLREAIDFEGSLKSSGLAQAVFVESRRLLDDQAARLAETALTDTATTGVEEALEADQNLSVVVDYIQRYFVVYLGYSPEQAHNLVRRIVWMLLFSTIVGGAVWGPTAVALSIGAVSAATSKFNADAVSEKAADTLIPDGKPDTAD